MLLTQICETYKSSIVLVMLMFGLWLPLSSFAQQAEVKPVEPNEQSTSPSGDMTQSQMAVIIGQLAGEYEGTENNIQFVYNDVVMALISDKAMNRMRIIAPITEVDNLTDSHIKAAMVSNFHLALDARYAIGNGILYATYIHPLKELTKGQLESAVRQVSSLRLTFGSTYSSGELRYGGRNPQEQDI